MEFLKHLYRAGFDNGFKFRTDRKEIISFEEEVKGTTLLAFVEYLEEFYPSKEELMKDLVKLLIAVSFEEFDGRDYNFILNDLEKIEEKIQNLYKDETI